MAYTERRRDVAERAHEHHPIAEDDREVFLIRAFTGNQENRFTVVEPPVDVRQVELCTLCKRV
jgi:hypothetical protein